jgi:GrpB-like predicted nucleotidyltransferase (UPF0157 family)
MREKNEKKQPVKLEEYNPLWPSIFQKEAEIVREILGETCLEIHHIGSTSIPGLSAKPIIDIIIVVNDLLILDTNSKALEKINYVAMGEYGIPGRRFFWKSPEHRRFNIHLFEKGNSEIERHLAFRDYLREHPGVASGYGAIKKALTKQFPNDIENYVDGKASLVQAIDYRTGTARSSQLEAQDSIVLKPYNEAWPKLAAAEIDAIKNTINLPHESINHLGSTSIAGMSAKPILDIFIGVTSMKSADDWIKPLSDLGYIDWPENPDKNHARYFKGMPPFGIARTHHIHIMQTGDELDKRILFRDRLRESEQLKKEYAELKKQLANENPQDREGYTNAKVDFIHRVIGE